MILDIVESINGVPIRLTEEQWFEHIVDKRSYMSGHRQNVLDCVYNPQFILRGQSGTLVAVVNVGRSQWLHVIYRENNKTDGFVITAYIKRDYNQRRILWQSNVNGLSY